MHYRGRYSILASLTPTQLPSPPSPPSPHLPSLPPDIWGSSTPSPALYYADQPRSLRPPCGQRKGHWEGTDPPAPGLLFTSVPREGPLRGHQLLGSLGSQRGWDWGSLDLNQSLSPAPGWSCSGRFSPDPIRGGVVPVLLHMGVMPLDPLVAQPLTQGSSQGLVCPGPQEPGGASGVGGARERLQGQAALRPGFIFLL